MPFNDLEIKLPKSIGSLIYLRKLNLSHCKELTEIYKGKQIPEGFKGLVMALKFCSDERTLIVWDRNTPLITIQNGTPEYILTFLNMGV